MFVSLGLVGWRSLGSQAVSGCGCSGATWVRGAQDGETAHERVIDRHQCTAVVELSAIVWRTEDGAKLSAAEELVAVLDDLMCSANKIYIVFLEELLDDGLAKRVRDTAVVLSPTRLSFLRVRPKQVAEKAIFGHFGRPCDLLELGDGDELGAQAAMHADDLVIDQRGDWHAVEAILELFPDADGVAALALVVETIDTIDLTALVVASQQEEVLLELDLVGQEQNDRLERVLAAIDVVAQEEVVGLRREPTILEQPQKVRELTMRVT